MKRLLAMIVLCWAMTLSATAFADGSFRGEWRQTWSNAGQCPTCRITIRQHGTSLQITANNDWTATAETGRRGHFDRADGSGVWNDGTRKTYSGKGFTLRLDRNGNALHMTMRIEPILGRTYTIEGIFKRVEQIGI